jgi:hypothetical protein
MSDAARAEHAAPALDRWLLGPTVRTHHRLAARASPATLWHAAENVRLSDTRRLGRLVHWRIPGLSGDMTYRELFRSPPFTVLDEGEFHSVSGLCGKIWTLKRDYPRIDGPAEFLAYDEPGAVRVLFAHWVEELSGGHSELVSEARIDPVDARAKWRVRALWRVVGPFEPFIANEPLPLAARKAEERERGA